MGDINRVKQRGVGLKPFANQPLLKYGFGTPVWHGVTPTRFAMELPASSAGPIRARQVRAEKGLPAYQSDSPSVPGFPTIMKRKRS